MLPTSGNKTHTQRRTNSKPPIARSNSLFGAIKNIVTAPLSWFGGADDFEDTKGKRRRLPQSSAQNREEDDGNVRTKRIRVNSPDRDVQSAGYLDPPGAVFKQQQQRRTPSGTVPQQRQPHSPARRYLRASSASAPAPTAAPQSPRNRHTLSPYPSSSHLKPESISRTMSLDPPSGQGFTFGTGLLQRQDTKQDLTVETRNLARNSMSVSRDVSMSPSRHLRMRTPLTPQQSAFNPASAHDRSSHEPPPLASLMANPVFVKPPKLEPTKQTLGSLVESQRSTRSPVRRSSILFGSGSMQDVSSTSLKPMNAAERVLQELDIYKTPLLPSRLKGSSTIPEMFMPKQSRTITLMRDEKDDKPRLGMKNKGKKSKAKTEKNKTKPYAGEGGIRKRLAKHRHEEEREKEKEREDAMQDDAAEERKQTEIKAIRKGEEEKIAATALPKNEPRLDSNGGREMSSLRVGRTRRTHIPRPVSRPKNRFSAVYDEDDEDAVMEETRAAEHDLLEEAAKKAPVFELPVGFTFGKSTPPIDHDTAGAKEPPISSLPFALIKSKTPPAPVTAPFSIPPQLNKPAAVEGTPARPPPIPIISLEPPTPQPVKSDTQFGRSITGSTPSPANSAIPNFFANSTTLVKPVVPVTIPSFNFGTPSQSAPVKDVSNPLLQGEKKEQRVDTTPKPSLFGSFGGSTSTSTESNAAPASLFGSNTTPITPSIFGSSTIAIAHKESSAAVGDQKAAALISSKQETSVPSSFSFGQSTKPSAQLTAQPESSMPSEAFGPGVDETKPISLFVGIPAAPTPTPSSGFSFSTPAKSTDAPQSAFGAFGQQAAPGTPAPTSPAPEPPKPLFGGTSSAFSFGQNSTATTTGETKPASRAFSFGNAPSTPAISEKKAVAFTFGASEQPAATSAPSPLMFGGPSTNTNASDVSNKPFSFGPTAPVRPTTPPKIEQEVQMEESPTREMSLNGSDKPPERPSLNFSFGTPTSGSSFGQSQTTSSSFGFGASTGNPFGAKTEIKTEVKPVPSFGGFGQTASTPAFSFQKPAESPAMPSPTAGPFSFAQPSPVAPSSPFTFGAPPNTFGQSGISPGSAPVSPSPFNQPQSTPFSFGAPATAPTAASGTTPFSFGTSSQPASPATVNNVLPQSANPAGGGFTFGQTNGSGAAATSAATFGTPAPSSGGALFTIGAAPPPPTPGGRQIKKLPARRGAKR